jgi:PKD repeat protein
MQDHEIRPEQEEYSRRSIFRFDALLFVFLLIGWSLIFTTATVALQRDDERWLPISLVPQSNADYSIDAQNAPKLAQVKPQIIEAVREDASFREPTSAATLAVNLPDITPTPSLEPTPSPTPSPGNLSVSAGGPYQGDEGSEILLAARGFNSFLNILPLGVSYAWDLDGDGLYDEAVGETASITFNDEGDYPVAVRASDLLGRTAIDLTVVAVSNVAPIVNLGTDVYKGEGEEILFSAEATDPGQDVLLFEWDFGDGSPLATGTLAPLHIYGNNGEYPVRLRVSDNDGGVTEETLIAYIRNLPPLVNAGPDQVVDEASLVTFVGTATDPADAPSDLSYSWDFSYDGETFTPDARGSSVSTTFPDGPDSYIIGLRVKDRDEGETIDTLKVQVDNVPPVIVNIEDNGPVGEGSSLGLEVTATDVGDDTLTYAFDWDDDGAYDTTQQLANVSNTWYNQGQHTVRIRVDDGDGGEAVATRVVSTFNLTPTALAQGPDKVFEGSAANFDAGDSTDPGADELTYQWAFGDGQNGSGVAPSHTYGDNGVYTVTLTVADDSGAADTVALSLIVLNANPVVDAGPDQIVDEGVQVNFVGSATDPGDDSLSYAWDFDYDGNTFTVEASGKSVVWTFPDGFEDNRLQTVAMRVRDDDYPYPTGNGGGIGESIDTLKIEVKNVPPKQVDAGGPYRGVEGEVITLVGSAEDVEADTLTYEWDLDDDGSFETTGQTVTHTWPEFGVYQVGLRVWDEDNGLSIVDTALVDINAVPTADAGGPYEGVEGSPITFNGEGSKDPDGDPLTYLWNFGDGTPATAGINTTHVYSDNRVYTATLTVRDPEGSISTDPVTVTVVNANPVANAGVNRVITESIQLNLVGSATDPGAGDRLSLRYAWDFDYDGNNFDVDATGPSVSVTYPDGLATFTVALRVRDDDYDPGASPAEIGEDIDTLVITVNNAAPVVEAGGPYSGVEGQAVTLTGVATDTSEDTLIYTWDLDGDGEYDDADTPSANYTWNTGGDYVVALQVTDEDGGTGLDTALVNVNFNPIITDAGGPYSGDEANSITFNASASDPDGNPLTYIWDFGDGTPTVTGASVSHAYANDGVYTVGLRVNDNRGGTAFSTTTVTIDNLPPYAVAGANPNPVFEGSTITFSSAGSGDPGLEDSQNLVYEWDFGDGSPAATEPNPSHVYADNDTHIALLTVRDDHNATATASITISVLNREPSADAGGPYVTTVGVATTLTGSGSDVPADVLSYAWDFDYDDVTFNADATGQTVTFAWPTPGDRTVALRVTDDDGDFTIDTTVADIGSPPTAVANANPNPVDEGATVAFDGSGSDDPDNDALTYTWDFDDGSPPANGPNVTHTYGDNGVYNVTLQVNDGRGGIDTDTVAVTVNNVAPQAVARANPNSSSEGTAITFNGNNSSDPGANENLSYEWDFGDGSPVENGTQVTHAFGDNGDYTVTLTVTDKDGASDQDTVTVTILNANPDAVANATPNPADEGTAVAFKGSDSSDPGANENLTYQWDFGDGTTSPEADPTYTYPDSGDYTVTLTVTDKDGGVDSETFTVSIANVTPTADAGGPYSTSAGSSVELTGNGSDPVDPVTYRWDLDDDGSFETEGQTVSFSQNISGTYTVTLEVSDDEGAAATSTTTVEVNNILPLAGPVISYLLRRRRRKKYGRSIQPGFNS